MNKYKIGILVTHPIQYYVSLYKLIEKEKDIDLTVYFCHEQTAKDQSKAGFGYEFEWDIPLLEGYNYKFLKNVSNNPSTDNFFGCSTPEIKEIIKSEKFDAFIIQGWYVLSYIQAFYACKKANIPVLIRGDSHLNTTRSSLKKLIKYPIYRFFIPKYDAYLYVGENSKEYYLHYGADERKMFFTPHAVDNDYFTKNSNISIVDIKKKKKELNIPLDSTVFLFVGKLIDIKRPLDFLKAIEIASKENGNIYGIMVGDGELMDECVSFIEKNDLPILTMGFMNQSKLPELYSISDVVVMTSESETWGLVVNEAMSSGLAAIVNENVGCSKDLIIKDKTGQIYKMGNTKELSELMLEIIGNNHLLENMKVNAKKHINKYSNSQSIKGLRNALNYIIK